MTNAAPAVPVTPRTASPPAWRVLVALLVTFALALAVAPPAASEVEEPPPATPVDLVRIAELQFSEGPQDSVVEGPSSVVTSTAFDSDPVTLEVRLERTAAFDTTATRAANTLAGQLEEDLWADLVAAVAADVRGAVDRVARLLETDPDRVLLAYLRQFELDQPAFPINSDDRATARSHIAGALLEPDRKRLEHTTAKVAREAVDDPQHGVAAQLGQALLQSLEHLELDVELTSFDYLAGDEPGPKLSTGDQDSRTTVSIRAHFEKDPSLWTAAAAGLQIAVDATRRGLALDAKVDTPVTTEFAPSVEAALSVGLRLVGDREVDGGPLPTLSLRHGDPGYEVEAEARLTAVLLSDLQEDVRSQAFTVWDTAEACDGGTCQAQVAGAVEAEGVPEGEVLVTARGAGGDGERLLLGWLADRETPGGAIDLCGKETYQGLPGTILFDGTPEIEGEKVVTVRVPRDIVQATTDNGRSKYDVCYLSDAPFIDRDGVEQKPDEERSFASDLTAGPALLPDCSDGEAPCVESRTGVRGRGLNQLEGPWRTTLRGGLEVVIRLPEGDPMFR